MTDNTYEKLIVIQDEPRITLVLDHDPTRCKGLKARYAQRCNRHTAHPTQLCGTHRDQDYCCRVCKSDEQCDTHGGGR